MIAAIERLKEEKQRVLFKNDDEGDGRAKMSIDFNEKKNWMSSIQLWSTPVHYESNDPLLHMTSVNFHFLSFLFIVFIWHKIIKFFFP